MGYTFTREEMAKVRKGHRQILIVKGIAELKRVNRRDTAQEMRRRLKVSGVHANIKGHKY